MSIWSRHPENGVTDQNNGRGFKSYTPKLQWKGLKIVQTLCPKSTVEWTLKLQWGKLVEQNVIVSLGFLSRIPVEQEGSIMSPEDGVATLVKSQILSPWAAVEQIEDDESYLSEVVGKQI
ncbi:hypothetical protein J1N35_005464 [Gossypium stocksii]|uniref:Uncharacterized protein n=1 Tax=Gossypium stocksii TaxID=47602 RepID=A0A9D3WDV5_9ROSI|nr:hypothetical protein J1N35_005464 [Gossypium stocksii]